MMSNSWRKGGTTGQCFPFLLIKHLCSSPFPWRKELDKQLFWPTGCKPLTLIVRTELLFLENTSSLFQYSPSNFIAIFILGAEGTEILGLNSFEYFFPLNVLFAFSFNHYPVLGSSCLVTVTCKSELLNFYLYFLKLLFHGTEAFLSFIIFTFKFCF